MTPRLRHVPADWLIPWQWWDESTEPNVYLAGFPTPAGAEEYSRLRGWKLP